MCLTRAGERHITAEEISTYPESDAWLGENKGMGCHCGVWGAPCKPAPSPLLRQLL